MSSFSQLLKNEFSISEDDLERAVAFQSKYGGNLEQILVNMGSLAEDKIPSIYSRYLNLPLFEPEHWSEVTPASLASDDVAFLLEHNWFCLTSNDKWQFVCVNPLTLEVNDWLVNNNIQPDIFVSAEGQFRNFVSKWQQTEELGEQEYLDSEDEKLRELAAEAPTVNLLNSLISRGLQQGASDMHLEPSDGKFRVRYRVDGVLNEADVLSPRMRLPIATRLKILSGMDIAEKRRPQDGKIAMRIAGQELDIRVSSLPLNDGESMVLRFLRQESVNYDMSVLGLSDDIAANIRRDLQKTAGVILLTGPTGSGKTTSLYTFLNEINSDGVKIITLEDPVEYQLDGINQVQVNSDIGFDFAAGLRSIVRQDPDVIMLGEIRDQETAQIALQSALTGHLVFSTVHTNDAPSAYTRLLDLGVEEFLLNAALISIVAQRLVRKVCPNCAVPHPDAEHLIEQYNLRQFASTQGIGHINLVQGNGCELCGHTGYKGREAIIEYLPCDDQIQAIPKDENFIQQARQHNKNINGRTLLEDGLLKALNGKTTIEEVLRVAG